MPSPFPGMDPYLEHSAGWKNVHSRLLVDISNILMPQVLPHYFVSIEERVYVAPGDELEMVGPRQIFVPDVKITHPRGTAMVDSSSVITRSRPLEVGLPRPEEVREPYLEIRDAGDNSLVVAVIEVLSPANKRVGAGRVDYLKKRDTLLQSWTNFVEIDLLRSGMRMPVFFAPDHYDYSVLVARETATGVADFYPVTMREPLPVFPVPLKPGEPEPTLDLNAAIRSVYDLGGFGFRIDYRAAPEPPLSEEDALWAKELQQPPCSSP